MEVFWGPQVSESIGLLGAVEYEFVLNSQEHPFSERYRPTLGCKYEPVEKKYIIKLTKGNGDIRPKIVV